MKNNVKDLIEENKKYKELHNITPERIKENIKLCEEGKPLTIPLSILSDEMKKTYLGNVRVMVGGEGVCEMCGVKFILNAPSQTYCFKCREKARKEGNRSWRERNKEWVRERKRRYHQRPEVKKRIKEYYQRQDVIKKRKEYYQRQDVIKKRKEYYQRPEVIERIKEYYQRPEVKKRKRKEYLKRKKKKSLGLKLKINKINIKL